MTTTPEDLIDELCHKVVLAPDERELELRLMNSSLPCKSTASTWRVCPPINSFEPSRRYSKAARQTP